MKSPETIFSKPEDRSLWDGITLPLANSVRKTQLCTAIGSTVRVLTFVPGKLLSVFLVLLAVIFVQLALGYTVLGDVPKSQSPDHSYRRRGTFGETTRDQWRQARRKVLTGTAFQVWSSIFYIVHHWLNWQFFENEHEQLHIWEWMNSTEKTHNKTGSSTPFSTACQLSKSRNSFVWRKIHPWESP